MNAQSEYQTLKKIEEHLGEARTNVGRGEYAFFCPMCIRKGLGKSRNPSLYINIEKGKFQCWRCEFKGLTLRNLGKALGIYSLVSTSLCDFDATIKEFLEEPVVDSVSVGEGTDWPSDYTPVIPGTTAFSYLAGRGVTKEDVDRYKIGYGIEQNGGRLIFPCIHHNQLVYWTTRAYVSGIPSLDRIPKKAAPDVERRGAIYGHDLFYKAPEVRICEGPTSAVVGNGVSVISKTYTPEQVKTLISMDCSKYIVFFDGDSEGVLGGIKLAMDLLGYQRNVYYGLFPLGKDPADVGREESDKIAASAPEFTDKLMLMLLLMYCKRIKR